MKYERTEDAYKPLVDSVEKILNHGDIMKATGLDIPVLELPAVKPPTAEAEASSSDGDDGAIAQEHQGKPQTIAPSPKRRWDKPSGRNFASYDELYQSMLPFSSSKGARCYRNHCLSCLAI